MEQSFPRRLGSQLCKWGALSAAQPHFFCQQFKLPGSHGAMTEAFLWQCPELSL